MKQLPNKLIALLAKLREFVSKDVDLVLLLFLLLVTNYRFSFKILAIVAIYFYRPNFKFKKSGIVYFYVSFIFLSLFNLLVISGDLSANHTATILGACLIWLACLLTFHQLQLFVEKNEVRKTVNTLKYLVFINLLFSVVDLIKIMIITQTINPYNQISPPPYGISSGDLIGGVFGEMHLVNMSISAFLLLFFLYQKNFLLSLLTVIPLLLTGSNLGTLITVMVLFYMLIIKKDLLVKYYILFTLAVIVIFYIKITPDNLSYFSKSLNKLTHKSTVKQVESFDEEENPVITTVKSDEDIKNEKIQNYLFVMSGSHLKDTLDSVYFLKQEYLKTEAKKKQKRNDYTHYVKDSLQNAKEKDKRFEYGKLRKFDFHKTPGKIISFQQVYDYLFSNWKSFLFGSGPGGFSSRLAFISSGIVDDSRILMALPFYENPDFTRNHKAIFKYLLFLDDKYHSITNLPFSWYNELLGEYGVVGLIIFIVFYLGFLFKRFKLLTFGKVLVALMLTFFLFDYWYERLSVMVLFEIIILLDIKMSSEKIGNKKNEN